MTGTGEEYTCVLCGRKFTKTRSDEEAMSEMRATWNEISQPELVCDGCFRDVLTWARLNYPEAFRHE